jgi:LmbE family N-acetylglucosaminyl deacetylase
MNPITRREVLSGSGVVAAAAAALPLANVVGAAEASIPVGKLKVVVVGAHPDDPESGCGGTMARLADAGHEVVSLYLTRGEAGIAGKSHDEAARIRTAEAEQACRILKARPKFAGQIDGATELNRERYDAFRRLLEEEKPDLVFAHWPIDAHRDHRVASLLTYDAWERMGRKFALYFFEVESGIQTQHFNPTDYVDITQTEARKRAACMAHVSQHPGGFYTLHDAMNRHRGMEYRCTYAEAFSRHVQGESRLSRANA